MEGNRKEKGYVQLKQLASKLMYDWMWKRLFGYISYFEHSEKVSLYVPDEHLDCVGYEAVRQGLEALDKNPCQWLMPILHSDAVACEEGIYYGHWNTYAFYGLKDGQARMGYHRIEITARSKEGELYIQSLSIVGLLYLEAGIWDSQGELPVLEELPMEKAMQLKPEEYIAIRNTFNRYIWSGPVEQLRQISLRAEVDWAGIQGLALPEQELVRLPIVTASGNPLLVSDGSRARGIFCTYIRKHQRKGQGGERSVVLAEEFQLLEVEFERMFQEWRILTVKPHTIASLQEKLFDQKKEESFLAEATAFGRQEPPQPIKHVDMTSDYFELESVLPQWTERLKRDDLPDFVDGYMKNSFYDVSICLSKSYYGYEKVAEHANRLINEQVKDHESMKKFPQFHTGNSPIIQVSADGMEAEAAWLDYGWGNIGARVFYEDEEECRKYFPGIGVYYYKFIRENGSWRLYKFGWKPVLLGLQEVDYNVHETGGWSNADTDQQWPLPFEEFRYPKGIVTFIPGINQEA